MKFQKKSIYLTLFFIIYPLLTVPFIFLEIYNNKKYAFTLLSLFMGIIAYLVAPTGDLYRHYIDYIYFKNLSFIGFLSFLPIKFDILLYSISFIFAKCGIAFEFIRFLFVFFSYQMIFAIFRDIIQIKPQIKSNKSLYFLTFIIFFFQVLFMVVAIGLRSGFATYLMIFGVYKIFVNHNNKGWYFIFLSVITHYSLLLVLLPIILAKFKIIKINKIILLFSFGLFFYSKETFDVLNNILPKSEYITRGLDTYINGYWGTEFLEDRSILFVISKYLTFISIYPLFIYLFFIKGKDSFYQLNLYLGIIFIIISPMATLLFRYSIFIVYIYIIWFFIEYKKTKLQRIMLYCLLVCTSLTFCLGSIYTFRKNFEISNELSLLSNSCPQLLLTTYKTKWIDSHITYDGDIIKNKK